MTAASSAKNKVCLWYEGTAEEAANFYASVFPDTRVTQVVRSPADYPDGKAGDVITVEFSVMGIECIGLNGGPIFKHSEAFSFQVETLSQEETDRYWDAIVSNGGTESACGWCKDRWGFSWQVVPSVMDRYLGGPDPEGAARAMTAMMGMTRLVIAELAAAYEG